MAPFLDNSDNSLAPIPDIVQNILFFIPFGFLGFWVESKKEHRICFCCARIAMLASSLSLSVEILQVFAKDRFVSTTDLITNTAGALAGFWLANFFRKSFNKIILLPKLKKSLKLNAAYPLFVSLIVVLIDQWQPELSPIGWTKNGSS